MAHTTKLTLAFLSDSDRSERNDEIELSDRDFQKFVKAGREIVERRGEFSAKEMDAITDLDYARLGASAAHGSEAYSLACASYLA